MDVLWSNTLRVIQTRTNGVSPLLNDRTPTTEDRMIQGTNEFLDQIRR